MRQFGARASLARPLGNWRSGLATCCGARIALTAPPAGRPLADSSLAHATTSKLSGRIEPGGWRVRGRTGEPVS